jgi:hypothetical protein
MLQSAYDISLSTQQLSDTQQLSGQISGEKATVKMMEDRIKELEGALQGSSADMGEVVKRMQIAQIEMIELAGEREQALRKERKLP